LFAFQFQQQQQEEVNINFHGPPEPTTVINLATKLLIKMPTGVERNYAINGSQFVKLASV